MEILTKMQIEQQLSEHYIKHYGKNDADIWHNQPAANVWVLRRDKKIITLKCHILTGVVSEKVKEER